MDREGRADKFRDVVREAVGRSSLRQVAEEVGVAHGTLHNYLNGQVPSKTTLTKIERWKALRGERKTVRAGATPVYVGGEWPEPEPDDPEEVAQYLTFFGADPEGFRRMARHLPLSDLAKAALQTALDEGMSSNSFEILYERLKPLLPRDDTDEG